METFISHSESNLVAAVNGSIAPARSAQISDGGISKNDDVEENTDAVAGIKFQLLQKTTTTIGNDNDDEIAFPDEGLDSTAVEAAGAADADASIQAEAAAPSSSATVAIPDGGWGWVVVFASFMAHLIADGCGFSFGVLFGELLDVFGETKGRTAWVGSLFVSVPAICGPVASALTNRYGCRRTTMAGGLIAAVGCVWSAFADSIDELCFTFGIVAGFGLSLVFVPSVIVVAFYFEKKRAFATGKCSDLLRLLLASHT